MKLIKILRTSNPHYWYAKAIGKEYPVVSYYAEDGVYLVRDDQGYLNIVHKDACQVVDERRNKDEEAIQEILDNFDFDTVHSVMDYLSWGWASTEGQVPEVSELRKCAERLLRDVVKMLNSPSNAPVISATGGFHADGYKSKDAKNISLKFVISDWDTFK